MNEPVKVYMPSHWRETIREHPQALIGFYYELNEHDAEVEDWEEVLVYPTLSTPREPEAWMVETKRRSADRPDRGLYYDPDHAERTAEAQGSMDIVEWSRVIPLYRSPSPYTDEDGPEGDGDE